MSKASEKRKHPRVPARGVSAHVNFADKSNPCAVLDISAGGMLVETQEPLPAGIPVAVNLAQPGWTRVLRLPGRVVWALAPRAASKKGTAPGMRIRFDPLESDPAQMLLELLHTLGIGETPPPEQVDGVATLPPAPPSHKPSPPRPEAPVVASRALSFRAAASGEVATQTLPGARMQELTLGDIVARISRADVPKVATPQVSEAGKPHPSAPRFLGQEDEAKVSAQVRGLKLQLAELQAVLDARDRELADARDALQAKHLLLEKAERERRAAETAIQRLSMQLASRR